MADRDGNVDLSDDSRRGSERAEEFKAVVSMTFLGRVDMRSSVAAQYDG